MDMDDLDMSMHSRSDSQHRNQPQHRKAGLLKNQLQLVRKQVPGGKTRLEIQPIEEVLSFDKGFFLFIRAVQLLVQNNEGVVIVGLAGPSGAGKTVFGEKVLSVMPGISLISMDNYNVASRVIDGNFDDPRISDYDLLLENLKGLREGRAVEVPIYDFKTSSRTGWRTVEVPSSRVIIIEGIYALSERLRPLLDLRVSITGGVHFDLVKRVLRDINRSGQEPEDIIQQISETVYPMYKAFIEPDLQTAHIKVVNKFNPFSGFQTATYILKAPTDGSDEEVTAKIRGALSSSHEESAEETYDIYLLPPGEDIETCQSYLRMRNRDGRYSLMFEEWVTDGPFIISPRITFEVSVRLLGGLMALGYEMAHILHRRSLVFADLEESKVTVKIDKLDVLKAPFLQVQGKDRHAVQEVARKLGMEGKFVANSYIEQIQLENLTQEIQKQAVPQLLKEQFRVPDEILRSPQFSASWTDGHGFNRRGQSQSWHAKHVISVGESSNKDLEEASRKQQAGASRGLSSTVVGGRDVGGAGGGQQQSSSNGQHQPRGLVLRVPETNSFDQGNLNQALQQQLSAISSQLTQLLVKVEQIETRLPPSAVSSPPLRGSPERNGTSALSAQLAQAAANGDFQSQTSDHYGGSRVESRLSDYGPSQHGSFATRQDSITEEFRNLSSGQRRISGQLESLISRAPREREDAFSKESLAMPLRVGATLALSAIILGAFAIGRASRGV